MTDHYAEQVQRQLTEARAEVTARQQHIDHLESKLARLEPKLAAAEAERDGFAAGVPLICSDERHAAKVRGLEALLVAGQKAATHWEGAYAREVKAHGSTERALSDAEVRIAAVRAAVADWRSVSSEFDPALDHADRIEAALGAPVEQPAAVVLPRPEHMVNLVAMARDTDRAATIRRDAERWNAVFAPTVMPEAVKPPTWAAMAALAERAQEQYLAERLRLEHAITTTIENAGLTVVRAEPVEEVAAHPAAIHRLRTEIFQRGAFSGLSGQIGRLDGLPVIPDDTLPPGEVHLRPHPRPARQEADGTDQISLDRIRQAWVAASSAANRLAELHADEERIRTVIDGTRRPTSLDLALIAEACGVTVDWLLGHG